MLNGKKIITVIPAYNVEEQISNTVNGIKPFVDHIIVVDDCSTDNTCEIVRGIKDRRVILVRTKKNQGVGGATTEGLKRGIELGGEIFVKFDGDGQMDPDKMEELIQPLFLYALGADPPAPRAVVPVPRGREAGAQARRPHRLQLPRLQPGQPPARVRGHRRGAGGPETTCTSTSSCPSTPSRCGRGTSTWRSRWIHGGERRRTSR